MEKKDKETAKNVIKDNFKVVSDNELLSNLSDINVENLIAKTSKGRSVWTNEFKKSFSENEKKARRMIRTKQLNLSKSLLHAILTKGDYETPANNLYDFYKKGLNDFSVFSNVSNELSPDKFKVIKQAYEKMKIIKKLK